MTRQLSLPILDLDRQSFRARFGPLVGGGMDVSQAVSIAGLMVEE